MQYTRLRLVGHAQVSRAAHWLLLFPTEREYSCSGPVVLRICGSERPITFQSTSATSAWLANYDV